MSISTLSRRCWNCGALIAKTSRRDRRYCNAACRLADYRRRRAAQLTHGELERLVERLESARSEAALVAGITQAASEDWQAAAWLLERHYPQRWSLQHRRRAPLDESDRNPAA
jgi:hypothetical protein